MRYLESLLLATVGCQSLVQAVIFDDMTSLKQYQNSVLIQGV